MSVASAPSHNRVVAKVDKQSSKSQSAFTLIEVIVTVGVLAVLVAILVPVLASGKRVAERATCLMNLRDLGVALRGYMDQEGRGILPALNGYHDQGQAQPGDFTRIVPLLAQYLDGPEPKPVGNGRYEPLSPYVCPHDHEIGPAFGLSYDYFPGALMINYATTGRLDPTLAVPVTRLYEAGEHRVLLADINPWHDHPTDGRNAAFWDGSAGPIVRE